MATQTNPTTAAIASDRPKARTCEALESDSGAETIVINGPDTKAES
jgi:hypothetical protein